MTMLSRPKMVVFDYGQTLLSEGSFDGVAGSRALMRYAQANPHGYTPQEVQAQAEAVNRDLGRELPYDHPMRQMELTNLAFNRYLYESLEITFSLAPQELEEIFWDAAAPAEPTRNILPLLEWLYREGIPTGVFSNISLSEEVLVRRLRRLLPNHHFCWILASSAYLFRKPHPRAFGLITAKAGCKPEEIWYCGDNPVCDVEGAAAWGIFPVWYRGASRSEGGAVPRISAERYLEIGDWQELIDLLESERVVWSSEALVR